MSDTPEHLPDELLARLAAVGGAWTGQVSSRWGSYEILTPATCADKYIWCSASGLEALLEEWEAEGGYHPRLALIFADLPGSGEGSQAAGRRRYMLRRRGCEERYGMRINARPDDFRTRS